VLSMAVPVIVCHKVRTRTFATTLHHQCKEYSPVTRAPSSYSRAGVSGSSVSR
jgi:hypothetical protein